MLEFVAISESSSTPPYEQLRMQVVAAVADGRLRAGDRLPPVRALASKLGLAANTVARSYRELEAAGVVVTAGRHGTRVAEQELSAADERRAEQLTRDYLAAMGRLGLSPESAQRRIQAAMRDW